MATTKKLTATAKYEKDTAKGKRRYDVSGKGIAGTVYLEDKNAPDEFEVAFTPSDD